jgi:hypothetical protein
MSILMALVVAYHRRSRGLPFDPDNIRYLMHFYEDPDLVTEARAKLAELEAFDAAMGGKLEQRDYDQGVQLKTLRFMLSDFDKGPKNA